MFTSDTGKSAREIALNNRKHKQQDHSLHASWLATKKQGSKVTKEVFTLLHGSDRQQEKRKMLDGEKKYRKDKAVMILNPKNPHGPVRRIDSEVREREEIIKGLAYDETDLIGHSTIPFTASELHTINDKYVGWDRFIDPHKQYSKRLLRIIKNNPYIQFRKCNIANCNKCKIIKEKTSKNSMEPFTAQNITRYNAKLF